MLCCLPPWMCLITVTHSGTSSCGSRTVTVAQPHWYSRTVTQSHNGSRGTAAQSRKSHSRTVAWSRQSHSHGHDSRTGASSRQSHSRTSASASQSHSLTPSHSRTVPQRACLREPVRRDVKRRVNVFRASTANQFMSHRNFWQFKYVPTG
jgi:hypothetical protein